MADRAPMKLGSVPATIMVVTLVVVAALLYFLTREDPQDSDVVAPPADTEAVEPSPADDDAAVRMEPQEPSGGSETADPAVGPSDGEPEADEDAEQDQADEREGTVRTDGAVPKAEPEAADPVIESPDGETDAEESAERDMIDESEGTARTGDAVSIEPGTAEDTTEAAPDPMPTADQPTDGVAELVEPASIPDDSVQPADAAETADGLAPGDETPPESEMESCEGIQPLTDDAGAAADDAIQCPDETDATAGERDTVPEAKAPTDGQATDGASGEGTGEEVAEDAGEAPGPADEAGESATESLPDVQDTVPETEAPADGQAADGAPGEGAEEEVTEDAGEVTGPADEEGETTTEPLPEVQDTVPETKVPTDGQATDGAFGEGTGDEVAEDAVEVPGPADEEGETTVESLPEVEGAVPEAEGLEPVERPTTMEGAACPDDQEELRQGEVGSDDRRSCPDGISKTDQPGVESEPRHPAPTERDTGPEMATEVPEESAVEDGDASAPPESPTEADSGPKPDGTADAVAPEGEDEVGTKVVDQSESGDETAVSEVTGKEPADGATGPFQDSDQKVEPASDQPGDSPTATESDDGPVGDDGAESDPPDQEKESMPDSGEAVDLETGDEALASSVADVVEDAAIEGESPVAESGREDLTPPSFDLVRVDRFGTTVLAGRAPADSLVEALVDGEVASSQAAGRIGQFAMIFSVDTQRDTLAIGLRATLPDGRSVDSDSSVFVVVPHGRMVPVNPVVEDGTGIESIAPVELPTTKLADLEELQPSVLLATNEGVRLIQPSVPDDEGKLLVEIVSYDGEGEVFIAGSTRSDGGRISIFLDGELVKSTEISPGGSWWTDLKGVQPGRYHLRVEEIDQTGTVVASVEMPFQKEAPEHAREMLSTASRSREVEATGADQGPIISLLAVQRGFTLWGISRKQYGLGRLYVNIFEANRDQINNPHLIYPGQIFILPDESQLVDPLW